MQITSYSPYVKMKRCPRNESFADGSVVARVWLMVREICFPVRGRESMVWKYDGEYCGCGQVETEEHVQFECNRYTEEQGRWRVVIKLKGGMHAYDVIKGDHLESYEIVKETWL